jgi:hypothetical protein
VFYKQNTFLLARGFILMYKFISHAEEEKNAEGTGE